MQAEYQTQFIKGNIKKNYFMFMKEKAEKDIHAIMLFSENDKETVFTFSI